MILITDEDGAIQLLCLMQPALLMESQRLQKHLFSGKNLARSNHHTMASGYAQAPDTTVLKARAQIDRLDSDTNRLTLPHELFCERFS